MMFTQFVGRFHTSWQNRSRLRTLREAAGLSGTWICNPARVNAALLPFSSTYTCSAACTYVRGWLPHHYFILWYHYFIWRLMIHCHYTAHMSRAYWFYDVFCISRVFLFHVKRCTANRTAAIKQWRDQLMFELQIYFLNPVSTWC